MSFLKRIKRLFQAQANATLKRVEDPEHELALLETELRTQRQQCRERLLDTVAALKQLEEEEALMRERIAQWERRAIQAVEWGDDALAKQALAEKVRQERAWSAHLQDLQAHREAVEQIKDDEVELDRQINTALRRRDALAGRLHSAQAMSHIGESFSSQEPASPMTTFGQIDRDIHALEETVALQASTHAGVTDVALEQKLLEAQRFREKEEAWQRDLAALKQRMAQNKDKS